MDSRGYDRIDRANRQQHLAVCCRSQLRPVHPGRGKPQRIEKPIDLHNGATRHNRQCAFEAGGDLGQERHQVLRYLYEVWGRGDVDQRAVEIEENGTVRRVVHWHRR